MTLFMTETADTRYDFQWNHHPGTQEGPVYKNCSGVI